MPAAQFPLMKCKRLLRGWNQTQLAKAASLYCKTNITQRVVSDYELGLRPAPGHLEAIAIALGISPNIAHTLLEETPDVLNPEARRAQVKARFAHMPDSRDAFSAEQLPNPGVPDPPDMLATIRRARGE